MKCDEAGPYDDQNAGEAGNDGDRTPPPDVFAEQRARQILEAANDEARRLRLEVEDFCDRRLGSFEIVLDRIQKTVAAGREKLNLGAPKPEEPEPETTGGNTFFDQDVR